MASRVNLIAIRLYLLIWSYEGESGKRVIGNKPALTKLLSVSPLVPISPGDFLGLFSGKLWYSDLKPLRAIKGPIPGLWLDYLEIPGKLNQMRIAKTGKKMNVCLAWEGVNEVKGEKSFCQYWRVLVWWGEAGRLVILLPSMEYSYSGQCTSTMHI